jgi:hypothetical protein
LIFGIEIALKKGSITEEEKDFFFKHFEAIKNFHDWRLNIHKASSLPSGFIQPLMMKERISIESFNSLKKELLKLYPDARAVFDALEVKIGKTFSYNAASDFLYKRVFKRD